MPRLIVQADDNAISLATALGVQESIQRGAVRNTGLFANMPAAPATARLLGATPDVSVGLDLNFVTGRPVSATEAVPDLVRPDGSFRSSRDVRLENEAVGQDGMVTTFAREPFPYEQTLTEGRAQLARFVELMGRPPAYLHHHALATPTTDRVITELAAELGVPVPLAVIARPHVWAVPNPWYRQPFSLEDQAAADPLTDVLAALEEVTRHDLSVLITHPGFVDAELLQLSSFSVVRARDLAMLCDPALRSRLDELGIELTTYERL